MERRIYKPRTPEIIPCPNLASLYRHCDRFLGQESIIYASILPNLPGNSASKSRRHTLENEFGATQVEARTGIYLLGEEGVNIFISSTYKDFGDVAHPVKDVPASCHYRSNPEFAAKLVFTYSPELDDIRRAPYLPDSIKKYIDRSIPIVPFQYFKGQDETSPHWHFVTNMAEMLDVDNCPTVPLYDDDLVVDTELFLDEQYASWAGTYLPFMQRQGSRLEFNPDFLLTYGPFHIDTPTLREPEIGLIETLNGTSLQPPIAENPFSSN